MPKNTARQQYIDAITDQLQNLSLNGLQEILLKVWAVKKKEGK